jgi:hypothetical protein
MTAQARDTIVYPEGGPEGAPYREDGRAQAWTIIGVAGSSLFDPAAHQLRVTSPHTGCWRGFYCEYAVRGGELLVTHVICGLGVAERRKLQLGAPPMVFGTPLRARLFMSRTFDPRTGLTGPEQLSSMGEFHADGLAGPMDFTGGLLLGRDLIEELVAYPGFHSPHMFQALTELTFEHGRLVDATDHSEAMVPYRVTLAAWAKIPRRAWYLRWLRPRPIDAPPPPPFRHPYD